MAGTDGNRWQGKAGEDTRSYFQRMVEDAGGSITAGARVMCQNLVLRSRAGNMAEDWGWDNLNAK